MRARTTGLAVAVVAAALVVGGVGLVVALRISLLDGVEQATRRDAEAAAEVLAAGGSPGILASTDDDNVAQVVDADGRVVASSRGLVEGDADEDDEDDDGDDGDEPDAPRPEVVLAPGLEPGGTATVELPDEDESFLAVAAAADTPEGPRTVVVASTLEEVDEPVATVARLLALGLPVLLLVVAVTTWRVVGRALRPVEEIRATAEAVSASDLDRRVPAPEGTDEVARLAATMNRMLDRLASAQARQRRFVADAAHELRSPVASIRQHAEVAQRFPDRTTTDALAGTVLDEALRLQRLVDDQLVLVRADEHALGLRRRPVDLDDLVLGEARRLRTTTSLGVDASGVSAGPVECDPDALARVVRNLVDNAARHATGRVALGLAEDGDEVVLTVDDDGPGIPAGERERVFERFVRLDDARARDGGGSGLGLAIVRELVTAHGGTVTVGEADLGGARFTVRLPARSDA
ncbi:MAG TPA: HAMP domain-containing sensor histidine kinase [Acidimicrobiales bacterium]